MPKENRLHLSQRKARPLELTTIRKVIERLLKEKESDTFYCKKELRDIRKHVLDKFEIIAAGEDFLYRGEDKIYPEISSSLRRKCGKDFFTDFPKQVGLDFIQNNLAGMARLHLATKKEKNSKENNEILDEIQHWGGETNFIDFTTKLEVALFFACSGNYEDDGRIILKRRSNLKGIIRVPKHPAMRVKAQKSVFVAPPEGYIEPDHEVRVPKELKAAILKCLLRLKKPVSIYTMYGGIYGFIAFKDKHRDTYFDHLKAFTGGRKKIFSKSCPEDYQDQVDTYERIRKEMPFICDLHRHCGGFYGKLGDNEQAIRCFKEALSWNSDDGESLGYLGTAYLEKVYLGGDDYVNLAMKHLNKSIARDRSLFSSYISRGHAYAVQNNHKHAIKDYNEAERIVKEDWNEVEQEADTYIFKLVIRNVHYFRGESLLYLKKIDDARSELAAAREFDDGSIESIKGYIIGRKGFREKRIELPDDVADLLQP